MQAPDDALDAPGGLVDVAAVVVRPIETRIVAPAVSRGTPIARRTWLGSSAPLVHALPAETWTPSRSSPTKSICPSSASPPWGRNETLRMCGAVSPAARRRRRAAC